MRKKELIAKPAVTLPKNLGCKSSVIVTGKTVKTSCGTVLETDVYYRNELVARHFTGRLGYWNYDPIGESWDGCSLDGLCGFHSGYTGWKYPSAETEAYKEAVRKYYKSSLRTSRAWNYVISEEYDIKRIKRENAEARKAVRLKKKADRLTPPLPKNFMNFIRKNLPDAGKHIGIQLYQPARGGHPMPGIQGIEIQDFIERQFRITNRNGNLIITEECRGIAASPGGMWRDWVYGCRETHGISQTWWDRKGYSVVTQLQRRFLLYTENLQELELNERQISLIKSIQSIAPECEWSWILRSIRKQSTAAGVIEYALKTGMTKLAREYATQAFYSAREIDTMKGIAGYFQITPQQLAYVKEINGGWRSITFLKYDIHERLRPEQLKKLELNVTTKTDAYWMKILELNLPIDHVVTLLGDRKGKVKASEISTYLDYLSMAEAKGSNIHDEIIYRNKRWREFHDRYVEELNARRAEEQARKNRERAKKQEKKFKGIQLDYKRNLTLFSWDNGEYCIEVPKTYTDIITEGQLQHHCVGASDTYMLNMAQRKSYILFLRKTAEPEKPYYTIEATTTGVKQFYAAYDRQPDKKIVQKILSAWMEQVKKNAKKLERKEKAHV